MKIHIKLPRKTMLKKDKLFRIIICSLAIVLLVGCETTYESRTNEDTTNLLFIDDSPDWSNANEIVFDYAYVNGRQLAPENPEPVVSNGIYIIDINGTNLRKVITDLELGTAVAGPTWSPDGAWIAFHAGAQIWRIRPDGTSLEKLTDGFHGFFPTWNSDGSFIAYDRVSPVEKAGIWSRKIGDTTEVRIAPGRYPSWSKNDSILVYTGLGKNIFEVHLVDSSVNQLTEFSEEFLSGGASIRYPKLSTNNEYIIFEKLQNLNYSVWLLNRKTGNLSKLIDDAATPTWSPDNSKILYMNPTGTNGFLWIYDMASKEKRQITF